MKTGDLFRVRRAGDADESCLVDIVDFSVLLLNFGSTSVCG